MKFNNHGLIFRSSVFTWIAVVTGLILLVPLIAMKFTHEVNWDRADFMLMGVLLFSTGSLYVLVARKVPRRSRVIVAAILMAVFLYIWAELAVGVFLNVGS